CSSRTAVVDRIFHEHHVGHCTSCGMTYALVESTVAELEIHYGNYPVRKVLSPVTALRYDELLERFEQYRNGSKILDVGCGAGMFLERAASKGWDVHGTEYGASSVTASLSRGIPVIEGPLDPRNYKTASFDVICSFEVIEHLTHPSQELDVMISLLRPGGLLYITTPNFNCLDRRISKGKWSVVNYPEHLNYFTPSTLNSLIQDKGMRNLWLKTTGMSISRLMAGRTEDASVKANARKTEEDLRNDMETKLHMKIAKKMSNWILNFFKLGDSMKAAYVKPES
ncbi:MAG: class I SAM-dependent methyltransferase, partial [Bacteroidota bacterium]|nr:class I SAM-dependent methyltransferase [Bacteroidota bacterium]